MEEEMSEMEEVVKSEGLEMLEESAKSAIKSFLSAAPKLILASPNKYDDMLIPLIGLIGPALLKLVDEINPHDNED